MKNNIFNIGILIFWSSLCLQAQEVQSWLTMPGNYYFSKQANSAFVSGSGSNSRKIYISEGTKYQTVEGFGWTLTQSSAKHINTLSTEAKAGLLNNLFRITDGIGCSVIRIAMGSSDLSESLYTYDEVSSGIDTDLAHFSLISPDLTDVIPIVQSALAINPDIRIIATPWTAPTWMKENTSWLSKFKKGNLNTAYYDTYAQYFIKYFEAMRALGIEIWAISPQNEPLNTNNLPSMRMSKEEQYTFITNHLGPAIAKSAYNHVKIIGYDHNCDNTEYPIYVSGSPYVDGTAFHLYAGNISALTTVHNATGKNVYFTEQYTSASGDWSTDFDWHMQNVMLGAMNNWARIALEWNLANNGNYTPYQSGGCSDCMGAITIKDGAISALNISYYLIAHLSKVVRSGAYRIQSYSNNSNNISFTAFLNPDGSRALVAYNNDSQAISLDVVNGNVSHSITIPGKAAISLLWNDKNITLQVVDKSKGLLTNKENDNNETNVFCWISDNLKAQNTRTPDDWWYPMYHNSGIEPDGLLLKTDTAWIWQTSLSATTGNYEWNPYMKTLGWKTINKNVYTYAENDNMTFCVTANGEINGTTRLTIPYSNTALHETPLAENTNIRLRQNTLTVYNAHTNIILYNITGKKLLIQPAQENETNIDLQAFSQGFYLLSVNGNTYKIQKTNK